MYLEKEVNDLVGVYFESYKQPTYGVCYNNDKEKMLKNIASNILVFICTKEQSTFAFNFIDYLMHSESKEWLSESVQFIYETMETVFCECLSAAEGVSEAVYVFLNSLTTISYETHSRSLKNKIRDFKKYLKEKLSEEKIKEEKLREEKIRKKKEIASSLLRYLSKVFDKIDQKEIYNTLGKTHDDLLSIIEKILKERNLVSLHFCSFLIKQNAYEFESFKVAFLTCNTFYYFKKCPTEKCLEFVLKYVTERNKKMEKDSSVRNILQELRKICKEKIMNPDPLSSEVQ